MLTSGNPLETAAARALSNGVQLTPPSRALLLGFGRNEIARAALGAMLHYIIKDDLNFSNHSY